MKTSPRIAAAVVIALILAIVPLGIGRIHQQPDALVYISNMKGIQDGADVVWIGQKVGAISSRSMEQGVHRLELTLDPAVFKTIHSDAEIRIDREHGVLVLVGGDRKTEPFLKKGTELPLERGRLLKSVTRARQRFEGALEKVSGYWEGFFCPLKKRPETSDYEAVAQITKRRQTDNRESDFFVVGSLGGIEVGAGVEWKGACIGKVTQLGYYERRQKAEVILDNGYFGKLRSDARIQIVQSEPPVMRIIGGDDANYKILNSGQCIPVQSISDEGKMEGAKLRSFCHDIANEFEELWRSISDKRFLKDIEESESLALTQRTPKNFMGATTIVRP